MFSALRQNSIVYILDKREGMTLNKCQVISVTAPKFNNKVYPQQMVVDIKVNMKGEEKVFEDVPANLSLATDKNLIISENTESMCNEVNTAFMMSKQYLESVPYHQAIVDSYENVMKDINPQYAKEREQENKINLLENKVTGIETSLSDIKTMLSKALNN